MKTKNEIFPKSKFLMCITSLKKDTNEENFPFKVLKTEWKKCNGKEFRDSIFESRKNGENISIEIVNQKPEKFVINQLYMLPTRDRVWVWVEED